MNLKSLAAASLLTAGLAAGCGGSPPSPKPPQAAALTVALDRADTRTLPSSFEAGGIVRARSTASLASRVLAPITDVRVHAGDRVRKGAPLVTLDGREIEANRNRAASALTAAIESGRAAETDARSADATSQLASAMYQRILTLHDKGSATPQELDQATAARDAAEAQKASAQARAAAATASRDAARAAVTAAEAVASYTTLTAPFDGVVTQRLADPGSMATPGMPILTLEDPTAFRLEVPLDEARAGQISVGQTAHVLAGEPSTDWIPGRVVEIARIDQASHSFIVKVDLPSGPALRSGQFGRARFAGPTRRFLTVPESALVRRGQLNFVFAVDSGQVARLRPISVGETTDGRVEVLAGIHDGDPLVLNPPSPLVDGTRVAGVGP